MFHVYCFCCFMTVFLGGFRGGFLCYLRHFGNKFFDLDVFYSALTKKSACILQHFGVQIRLFVVSIRFCMVFIHFCMVLICVFLGFHPCFYVCVSVNYVSMAFVRVSMVFIYFSVVFTDFSMAFINFSTLMMFISFFPNLFRGGKGLDQGLFTDTMPAAHKEI